MTTDLKAYPAMKDSGVPRLREVPEHWSVLPKRVLFAEVKEGDQPEEQMLTVTITRGVVPQKILLTDSSKKDSSNLDTLSRRGKGEERGDHRWKRAADERLISSEFEGLLAIWTHWTLQLASSSGLRRLKNASKL